MSYFGCIMLNNISMLLLYHILDIILSRESRSTVWTTVAWPITADCRMSKRAIRNCLPSGSRQSNKLGLFVNKKNLFTKWQASLRFCDSLLHYFIFLLFIFAPLSWWRMLLVCYQIFLYLFAIYYLYCNSYLYGFGDSFKIHKFLSRFLSFSATVDLSSLSVQD